VLDVVLRGGTVVDGTGAPGRIADVGIRGDRIVAVGTITEPAREEVDCTGLLVTPGFVDMHTHYDGQVTWDPWLTPSGWHGCTTVVFGNCGVGFAPCRPDDRAWLIQTMEGVEDIPGTALSEGIQWEWETFPEYLDALAKKPLALDVAAQVPHAALRGYVMGPRRAEHEDATPDEIAAMRALTAEALRAGAVGFSSSRTSLHKTKAGQLVAGTKATRAELDGICQALADVGQGVVELANEHVRNREDVRWFGELAASLQRPVVFNLSQIDDDPRLWSELLGALDEAARAGVPLFAQSAGRAIGILMGLQATAHPFALRPSWLMATFGERANDPWETRLQQLRDPAFRERLLSEEGVVVGAFETFVTTRWDRMFPVDGAGDYEPRPEDSVAARAAREGRSPSEVALDWLLRDDGEGMLYFPLFNYADGSLDPTFAMHSHDRVLMGLSDGGAHCGAICDAGMPTFMLTHWTRDRTRGPRLPLERIVARQTRDTAEFYGMHDRGVLAPGYLADVNVIDYAGLQSLPPERVTDLPAGGRRLIQRARGYVGTWKRGVRIVDHDAPTGALPGQLVRGGSGQL
jgi:N-acyl-D-amino-acid deacylase